MKNVNKLLFLQNLRFLANKEGDKTGEIEKAAGVSQGYLSRISRTEENPNMPLMDLLLWASDRYKIAVDTLLNCNLQSLTPNENYFRTFFEKVIKDTRIGILSWTSETKNMLENHQSQFNHPLMRLECYPDGVDCCRYRSLFKPDYLLGDYSLFCDMNQVFLFVTQVQDCGTRKKGFDVYFANNQRDDALEIVHVTEGDKLYPLVETVFNEGLLSSRQIKVSKRVRSIVDSYMKEDEDDLPF